MIRTGGHDLIDDRILYFVWSKVVQIKHGVKPPADFVLVVLVLGRVNAWGTASDSGTLKCIQRN